MLAVVETSLKSLDSSLADRQHFLEIYRRRLEVANPEIGLAGDGEGGGGRGEGGGGGGGGERGELCEPVYPRVRRTA